MLRMQNLHREEILIEKAPSFCLIPLLNTSVGLLLKGSCKLLGLRVLLYSGIWLPLSGPAHKTLPLLLLGEFSRVSLDLPQPSCFYLKDREVDSSGILNESCLFFLSASCLSFCLSYSLSKTLSISLASNLSFYNLFSSTAMGSSLIFVITEYSMLTAVWSPPSIV